MKKIILFITLAAAALLAAASCANKTDAFASMTIKYEVSFDGGESVNVEFAVPQMQDLMATTIVGGFSYQFSVYGHFPAYIHAQKAPSCKDDVNITLKVYRNDELVGSVTAEGEAVLSKDIRSSQN